MISLITVLSKTLHVDCVNICIHHNLSHKRHSLFKGLSLSITITTILLKGLIYVYKCNQLNQNKILSVTICISLNVILIWISIFTDNTLVYCFNQQDFLRRYFLIVHIHIFDIAYGKHLSLLCENTSNSIYPNFNMYWLW